MKKIIETQNFFSSAKKRIESILGENILMLLDDSTQSNVSCIDSGSKVLNKAIGTDGYPLGRIVEIYGPESCGKTTLALIAIAKAQQLGYKTAYLDVEQAMNKQYAKTLGVDGSKLVFSQPNNGEEAFEVVELLIKEKLANLIVVDSVAALVPQAEVAGEMTDQSMGLQARMMGKALRRLTPLIAKSNTVVIFINQIREKVGVFYGPSEVTPGGRALKFFSSLRIEVRKEEKIVNENKLIGNKVKVKVVKNKLANPFNVASLSLYFDRGINEIEELVNDLLDKGVIEKKGSFYYFEEKNLAQGIPNLLSKIEADKELLSKLTSLSKQ